MIFITNKVFLCLGDKAPLPSSSLILTIVAMSEGPAFLLTFKPFRSTKEVLHFIEGNRLEIVDQQTFNESYVVVVKKADSFL